MPPKKTKERIPKCVICWDDTFLDHMCFSALTAGFLMGERGGGRKRERERERYSLRVREGETRGEGGSESGKDSGLELWNPKTFGSIRLFHWLMARKVNWICTCVCVCMCWDTCGRTCTLLGDWICVAYQSVLHNLQGERVNGYALKCELSLPWQRATTDVSAGAQQRLLYCSK